MTDSLTTYEIHVDRRLDDHWSEWFGDVTIHHRDDGTSLITAQVVDQAQLHGLLTGFRNLNVGLISIISGPAKPSPALAMPLRTERLVLRAGTDADTEATWRFRNLASVNEWLTGTPDTLEGYRELFTRPDRLADTVVVELTSGEVIGDFMLRREDAWAPLELADQARGQQVELGWVLDPSYGGVGYATEAVRALLDHCFRDLGVRRVHASCFLDNDASWRLMERVGMRREGHSVADSLHRSGQWLDTVTYAVLREPHLRARRDSNPKPSDP